ncbi:glycosyltransferase family 4 protein [Chloroflexota bacterium]
MKNILQKKVILVRSRAIDPAVNKIAHALTENGYTVELLVWAREGRKTGKINNSNCLNIHRFSFKAPYYKLRLLFYLPVWWIYEFYFLLMNRANVIHVCDLDTLLPAIFVKVIKRSKLCYIIYDFYADILPQQTPNFIVKLVSTTEKYLLGFVDALFLVDESRYEQIRGAKINRIEYIYNSPEDYLETNLESKHIGINIFYAGYLDESRGLVQMMKAVSDLDSVQLTIAGTGPLIDTIESNLTKLNNLHYIGQISYQDVITNSLKADILFAFYDPHITSNKYASPNKLFEAMMCSKPIIVNAGTTASNIVAQEKCGIVIPYGNSDAIKKAILILKNNPELRRIFGQNGRKAYDISYNWKTMKGRLVNTYNELIGSVMEKHKERM